MNKSKIRKGLIVEVTKYNNGNPIGSIVKTISQPGTLSDKGFNLLGRTKKHSLAHTILCEVAHPVTTKNITHNNKQAFYELIEGLELATPDEKLAYIKGVRHVNNMKLNVPW